ncbi:MAG: 6-hydroxymethylpterin diphosphokinase MptE-like protein [Spirochaetota bacterium]
MTVPPDLLDNYRTNLGILARREPRLHRLVREAGTPDFEAAAGGRLTARIEGRYLESRYRAAAGGEPGETPCFLGSGMGYHINRLVSGGGPPAVLVEADPRAFAACLYVLEPRVLERLRLLVARDVEEVAAEPGLERCRLVRHRGSIALHPSYYRAVELHVARRRAEQAASRQTDAAAGSLWARNVIKNLPHLEDRCRTTGGLRGACRGAAILVASGPFLEESVGLLRAWQESLPVLALLPSLPYLLHQGVRPHLAVATDAGFWNRHRMVPGASTPLLATLSLDSVLFRSWPERLYLFSHQLPLERELSFLARCLQAPMQGTVAIVLILLARAMGFTRLYLAGYDFCFDWIKDHHRGGGFDRFLDALACRLAPRQTLAARRVRRAMRAPGTEGEPLYTDPALLLYRSWLEREVPCGGLVRLNRGLAVRGVQRSNRISEDPAGGCAGRFSRALLECGEPVRRNEVLEDLDRLAGAIAGVAGGGIAGVAGPAGEREVRRRLELRLRHTRERLRDTTGFGTTGHGES